MTVVVDRPRAIRRALVELVAERGLHGASMSAVAERAGVATGTAYVHYSSKEDLLIAAFVEVKTELGEAGVAGLLGDESPAEAFSIIWRNVYAHVYADAAVARFLVQVENSPIRDAAHDALLDGDALAEKAEALAPLLVDLPLDLLYDLGLGPAVRLAAYGHVVSRDELDRVVNACWRAVTRG